MLAKTSRSEACGSIGSFNDEDAERVLEEEAMIKLKESGKAKERTEWGIKTNTGLYI